MSRKLSGSSNEGVSSSSSRELRRDIYDFRFPPREARGGNWFDPCSMSSSQESRRFSLSRTTGDRDCGFRNLAKVKVIDVDAEPYASCSTQGSTGLEAFDFSDEGIQKVKKLKKTDSDPFEYNSSEELEEILAPPQRKGRGSGVFEFSKDLDFQKSKKLTKADFDPFEYNSSEELERILAPPKKMGSESGVFDFSEDVDLQKLNKLTKANYDPYEYNSSEELMEIGAFDFSEDVSFQKSKKPKKADFDPFRYNSSQELKAVVAPPQRKSKELGVIGFSKDAGFKKSKKLKKTGVDPYEYNLEEVEAIGANPQRKSKEIAVFDLSEDAGFEKSKKLKEAVDDPYEYNSEELEAIVAPPQRKSKETGAFDFSEGVGFKKSKNLKKAVVDPYEYNSEELEAIVAPPRRKSKETGAFDFSEDVGFKKSKNLKKAVVDPYEYNSEELEAIVAPPQRTSKGTVAFDFSVDVCLQKSKKLKKADFDPYEYNSSEELEGIVTFPQKKKYNNVGLSTFVQSSSRELCDLGRSQSRKYGWNELNMELDGVSTKSKKKDRGKTGALEKRKKKKKRESRESEQGYIELTETLMEAQESEKTTEHTDDVDIALDGLKKGQRVRIRRASLVSLLSICRTSQQRRLLWAHGNARKIIDAIFGISFDDRPSNLAAAALFYLLTSDGGDEHLLYSPSSIHFLIKLLKPLPSAATKEKSLPIGSKLLGLCKNAGYSQNSAKETDFTSTEIMLKVREILVDGKEMKPIDDSDEGKQEPELNSRWISLLIIEKACSSNISIEGFEETSRTLQKAKSNFKKKLREFGGLDAVFEVARKCHSVLEEWLEKSPSFTMELKNISGLESLVLLVKCLKIMENATFLSNDNQCHLLAMKGSFGGQQAPRSFIKLILSVIKILSGVSLLRSSISYGSSHSGGLSSIERVSSESFDQCDPRPLSGQPCSTYSSSEATQVSLHKWRVESSQTGLCSGTSRDSGHEPHASSTGKQKLTFAISRNSEDIYDPYVFEDDSEPSNRELLSRTIDKSSSRDGRATMVGYTDTTDFVPASQQESNDVEYHHSQETYCSSDDEDKSNLLADCLLTAVKVLMNLSNDNSEGCRQIASSGGLEILSSLIAGHFPSFSLPSPHSHHASDGSLSSKSNLTVHHLSNKSLSDQEMDFLVAILGLLVNLVEKDSGNRSRLAAARVSPPRFQHLDVEKQSNMIPILCSIFLANQGTSEAAGEEKVLSWEDEESILQGEKEAEKMIVEAYAALLLAFLSTESKKVRNTIAECLPNRNLKILVPVLERFVEFHMSLNVLSPETHSSVLEVIESCKMP